MEKHFGAVGFLRVVNDAALRGGGGGSVTTSGTPSSGGKGDGISFVSAGRDSMINFWSSNGDCIGSSPELSINILLFPLMSFRTCSFSNRAQRNGFISE